GVTPTLRTSSFVRRPVLSRGLAGTLCPNAIVAGGRRLDDIAPDRFLIVTSVEPTDDQRFEITRRGAFVVVAPAGSTLGRWLAGGRATAAIVRPDRTVMRTAGSVARLYTELPTFAPGTVSGSTR